MSEQCEQDKKLNDKATKAARKKIASESVKHRRVDNSVTSKKPQNGEKLYDAKNSC